jgi:hypothetical protein
LPPESIELFNAKSPHGVVAAVLKAILLSKLNKTRVNVKSKLEKLISIMCFLNSGNTS